MSQKHVFISYARVDGGEFARWLYDELLSHEIPVWIDAFENTPGSAWSAGIDLALDSAQAVLLVWSFGARASEQVEGEWNDALRRELPIIPLVIDGCELPRVLATRQPLDFRDRGHDKFGLAALRRTLRHLEQHHRDHLQRRRAFLEEAQRTSLDTLRFQSKIDEIDHHIAALPQGELRQRCRIETGLAEQRRELQFEAKSRALQRRQKVVGERPSKIVEYFKDREKQRFQMGQLLADPSTRMVTVIGRSGLGKSAIASKVLADMERNIWPHTEERIPVNGIVYLSTRTGGITLERIFRDCARLLGGEEETRLLRSWTNPSLTMSDRIDRLLERLIDGLYVVLLDNFEDLLDDDGQITDTDVRTFVERILSLTGSARLLITSRLPLKVSNEVMRFNHQIHLNDGLPTDQAVQMLRELDPNNDYLLRDAPEVKLADIAKRVHGVPRALEVLVGLLADDPFLTADDLIARFYSNQGVVDVLVESAYRRLDQTAQRTIQAIAVFDRPMPVVAIDFILEPFIPGIDIPNLLRRLERIHMVSVDRTTKRVYLHAIDRDLAYTTIPETGDFSKVSLERRAARYYEQIRIPRERCRTIDDLEPYLWQFEHLLRSGDADAAATVLSDIDVDSLIWHGHAQRVLSMRQRLGGQIHDPHLQLRHAYALGHAQLILGPLSEAHDAFCRAHRFAVKLGEDEFARRATGFIGETLRRIGDYRLSTSYLETVVESYRAVNNGREEAWWLFLLSLSRTAQGEFCQALLDGERALRLAQACKDPLVEGRAHNGLGLVYLRQYETEKASEHVRRAAELYKIANWIDGLPYLYNMQGVVCLQLGDDSEASKWLARARDEAHEAGQPRIETIALLNMTYMAHKNGERELALDRANHAAALAKQTGALELNAAAAFIDVLERPPDRLAEYAALKQYAKAAVNIPDLYCEADWDRMLASDST